MSILDKVVSYELRGFKNIPGATEQPILEGIDVVDNRVDDPAAYAEYLKDGRQEAQERGVKPLKAVPVDKS